MKNKFAASNQNQNHAYIENSSLSFFKPIIPSKRSINQSNDPGNFRDEQKADAIAERRVRMPNPITESAFFHSKPLHITPVQRKYTHYEGEERVQMKEKSDASCGMTAPPVVYDVINRGGQPLDTGIRGFMESRFGYDLGNVQVHNDSLAHQSSAEINALAYTHGNHIVFGEGQYRPENDAGKLLLAHELAHTAQQKNKKNHIQRKVRKSLVKDCEDLTDKPVHKLITSEQMAFDQLRKGIDKIQLAEDQYGQAVNKYFIPTLNQLKEYTEAFEMAKYLRSSFGFSAHKPKTWDNLHLIKIRFMKTISYLDSVVFEYVCDENDVTCPEKRFAYVDLTKSKSLIHLCPKFWESTPTERGLTISHEIMHLWSEGFLKDTTEEIFGIVKITPIFRDVNRYEKFLRLLNR